MKDYFRQGIKNQVRLVLHGLEIFRDCLGEGGLYLKIRMLFIELLNIREDLFFIGPQVYGGIIEIKIIATVYTQGKDKYYIKK